ncbi:hybrid sensor histidine kinase/response regulator [Sulfurospirillum arcachonense]|uniref:hybrid sensor histidine kinase/response regulator n=1 Tax=Sulfurospirillum arcachonense TaxID=57666 RepID=UPI00046A4BD8|nr:chemotaxis protein CheW [Sulfurospirillum arcachonense]
MDDIQEILEDFLIEAFELIEQLDQDLVELESNPEDLELLNSIFRVAHTVKGSSSFLSFDVLTKLTHHMEDVLNKARKGELKITEDVMDVVLESIDMMKTLLHCIRDNGNDTAIGMQLDDIIARLEAVSEGKEIPEEATKSEVVEKSEPEVDTTPEPEVEEASESSDTEDYSSMSDDEVEAEIERLLNEKREETKKKKAIKKEVHQEAPAKADSTVAAPTAAAPTPPAKKQASTLEQTIRVEVNRLDHLMNLIGELVLGKNRLLKIYDDVEERYEGEKFLEELNQVVSAISLVTTDLQIAVMKTRMLPIAKVFNKFPRMVRDLSRELGKGIELKISGEETELDKSIVEEIGDPLVHIIRNSCDHGVEDGDTREALGKNKTGLIELKAYNEGNSIVIEITDDGKGLDADLLRSKAIERGMISEQEADSMSDREAFALIFKPAFSMAAKVTNVSGRGVGMDVVKTNIEKLNGIIEIDSEIGKGTVIKMKIPLTLAIIQALLVGAQEEFYAIPLASVSETVRISLDEIYTVEGRNVLRLRDEVLSLVRLSDIFGVKQVYEPGEHTYVVVIGLAESKLGIIVDTLVGQEETVIKSMGDYLQGIDGIAGATIRGDGGVTLIVDIASLMEMAKGLKVNIRESMQSKAKKKTSPEDYTVLVVDDSKMDRTIMKKSMEPIGLKTIEASNGQEALTMLKSGEHDIDVILIDIEMPRMDGYTLATEIRKYSRYKKLPLIAVTSRTSKADRLRGVESGMTEYITKPYSPEYLENVVRKNTNLIAE